MIVSIVGKSKRGKTTLLNQLIVSLKKRGYTICVVKHSDQLLSFKDFDHEGKDTYTFSQAGADEVWLTSPQLTYYVTSEEMALSQIIKNVKADIIFTEGFKKAPTKKIVIKEPGESIEVNGEIILTIEGEYNLEEIVEFLIQL